MSLPGDTPYHLLGFYCCCREWSKLRIECDNKPECAKKVRKYIYDPEGRKCKSCRPEFPDIPWCLYMLLEISAQHPDPEACGIPGCNKAIGHLLPHLFWSLGPWSPCNVSECSRDLGHDGPHWSENPEAYRPPASRDLAVKLTEIAKEGEGRLGKLSLKVLGAMGTSNMVEKKTFVSSAQMW
jgi:hypothetical protein